LFAPQPEGGYVVTSPVLPELITEGDTLEEAWSNVPDALAAVKELYADTGRTFPSQIDFSPNGGLAWASSLVSTP
jgi:antitoxin HicB